MQIRKAVIPAAGAGTRFLPLTRTVPKELLPILDRPMIQFVIEEALRAGITELIIVSSDSKPALSKYFCSQNQELASHHLTPDVNQAMSTQWAMGEATYIFVNQPIPLGLGDAILQAQDKIGNEPFAVLLPDDVIFSREPTIQTVISAAQNFGASALAVEHVLTEHLSQYGVIEPETLDQNNYRLVTVEEKPDPVTARSNLGIIGRYVFTPGIFEALRQTSTGKNGELQLTDGISKLLRSEKVFACQHSGTRFDVGNPIGLLKASVALLLANEGKDGSFRRWIEDQTRESSN